MPSVAARRIGFIDQEACHIAVCRWNAHRGIYVILHAQIEPATVRRSAPTQAGDYSSGRRWRDPRSCDSTTTSPAA
jgi:hypothetical protein